MDIYYSPYYNGPLYTGLTNDNSILMDKLYVDTEGLVSELELYLGLHPKKPSHNERLVAYYHAMKQFMAKYKDNVLGASYELAPLQVAQKCLSWRDALSFDGWSKDTPVDCGRLGVLRGVEEHFDMPSLTDRINTVMECIAKKNDQWFNDWHIKTPCEVDLFHPIIRSLIAVIEAKGGSAGPETILWDDTSRNIHNIRHVIDGLILNTELAPLSEDGSVRIQRFRTQKEMMEYWAVKGRNMKDTLWINADNKAMDNWLESMGQPTTGSSMEDSSPQVVQLFVLGLGLFAQQLNIHSLLDWLLAPVHPLPYPFRSALADMIAAKGGYANKECNDIVNDYLEGRIGFKSDNTDTDESVEDKAKRETKEAEKRKELVDLYLPNAENCAVDKNINTERLRTFICQLGAWASDRARWEQEKEDGSHWVAQLYSLAELCSTLRLLLDDVNEDSINHDEVSSWASTLFTSEAYLHRGAEQHCRMTVATPAQIVAIPRHTIWMNVHGGTTENLDCDFLLPSERQALKPYLQFWDRQKEAEFHQVMMMRAISYAGDSLTLCVCDFVDGEPPLKHPVIVMLENFFENIEDITEFPTLDDEEWRQIAMTCNERDDAQINFSHADQLQWPSHLSATALESLVQYPFDFMMDKMLHINATGPATLPQIFTTRGTVAHDVIQHLFEPINEVEKVSVSIVRERLIDYDRIFDDSIAACGAILLLPEYKLATQLLKDQLHRCIMQLMEVMEINTLKVTACEKKMLSCMHYLSHTETDMVGYIDMTLEDEQHKAVIFDFKWSRSPRYRESLEKDLSLQLELYRAMLEKENKDTLDRVGYFLMPEGKLYSQQTFKGDYCVKVNKTESHVVTAELHRSFLYRKHQLESGIVEIGDGQSLDQLDYYNDNDVDNSQTTMLPLKEKPEGVHEANGYSNYNVFKVVPQE